MRLRFAVVLLLAASACSDGSAFSPDNLQSIALSPDEAPAGTTYAAERSGEQTLEDFGGSATELEERGFQGAYAALFVGEGEADGHAHEHTLQVANFLAVFADEEGAEWSFDSHLQRVPPGGYEELPTDGLGDDAFAAHGEASDSTGGEPWTVYSWRAGNLHVSLSIQGQLPPEDAEALARAIDERADSVASG